MVRRRLDRSEYDDVWDARLSDVPGPPEPEPAHGWLTAEQIFGSKAAGRRLETICITVASRNEFGVLATNVPFDLGLMIEPVAGIPRDKPLYHPDDELDGQLGMFG